MANNDCDGCCAGAPGPVGPQGVQGLQGPVGANGADGKNGAPGANGANGVNGVAGPVGPMGPAGAAGVNGVNGLNGAQGPQGEQGAAGVNGAAGLNGAPGADGATGAQGPMGLQGQAGPQGLQGVPGDCVNCPCDDNAPEYAEVYSNAVQNLKVSPGLNMAGGVVLLENTVTATANLDVSKAASLGQITVNRMGWYDVATGICGALNPIPAPLPCWTLSLFKNGVLVPGSTFANQTISPEQQSNEIVADVYVHCMPGDVLTLASTSTNPVTLSSPALGTNAVPSSAYLKISSLQLDV